MQSPGIVVLVDAADDAQRYHCEVSVGVGVPLNVAVPVSVSPSSGDVSLIAAATDTDGAVALGVPPPEKEKEKSPAGSEERTEDQVFVVRPLLKLVVFGLHVVLQSGVLSDRARPLGK